MIPPHLTFVLIGRRGRIGILVARRKIRIGEVSAFVVVESDAQVGHLGKVDAQVATTVVNVLSVQSHLGRLGETTVLILNQRL